MFCPTKNPLSLNPWEIASTNGFHSAADVLLSKPTIGIACCACAESGQTAAPPRSATKSRRLILPLKTTHRTGSKLHWEWGDRCPLWIKSGHVQCKKRACLLWANSGQYRPHICPDRETGA